MDSWPLEDVTCAYGLNVHYIEPREKILYIETEDNKRFALKHTVLQPEELDLEYDVCEHIYRQGFHNIARIIPTRQGSAFAQIGHRKFLLTNWLEGYHPDFTDPRQLNLATQGLAKFHLAARGYKGKVHWQKRLLYGIWPQRFSYRLGHLHWYQKCVQARGCKEEFDELFIEHCPTAIQAALNAIHALRSNDYYSLATEARECNTICHHDVAHHNILINSLGQVSLLDFDYCLLDQQLHDLASLIWRSVKLSNWTFEPARRILLSYHQIKSLTRGEAEVIFNFLQFPQDFWQLAWAKYSEVGLHNPDLLLTRLRKLVSCHEASKEFLAQLHKASYSKKFLPGRDSL